MSIERIGWRGPLALILGAVSSCVVGLNPARATPPMMANSSSLSATNELSASTDFFTGIARRDTLLGNMWGVRPWLSQYGLSLNILETSEVLGNVSGGSKQGADYDGLTQLILQLDTEKAFHLYGGTFYVSALQIHGRNLSEDNLGTLQTASGIESDRATRLWELWYDQKFDREGKYDLRVGQQSLDQEFMVSQNAQLFVNTMFGWPMVPSADMLGGGPAYPLSALGGRGRVRLGDAWTLQAGVFTGDARMQNMSGTRFPLDGGALVIGELQYAYPSPGAMVYGDQKTPLSRVYKLGFWYDTEDFDDQRYDNTGLSLANPASTGMPRSHPGNFSIYAVADQMIWADPKDDDRNINLFLRAMGTPLTDRNLIDFSLNAGFTFNEPIRHRDDDVFGIGMGYTHVSSNAANLDRDTGVFSGTYYPVRGSETFVEMTYRYQFTPWCQFQPDFQYVFNPGGGIAGESGQLVKNEAVIGLRVNMAF